MKYSKKFYHYFRPAMMAVFSVILAVCVTLGAVLMGATDANTLIADASTATAQVGGEYDPVSNKLAYHGVNSMVGTLISWNGKDGGYNLHSFDVQGAMWIVDNNGEMVNGADGTRRPSMNIYTQKNDNLSAIKLIGATNNTPANNTEIKADTYKYTIKDYVAKPDTNGAFNCLTQDVTLDNIEVGNFNGQSGVKYFTVGGEGSNPLTMAEQWQKAILAASFYSKSGLFNNLDFGGASHLGKKSEQDTTVNIEEFSEQWVTELLRVQRDATGKVTRDANKKDNPPIVTTTVGGNYQIGFGSRFNGGVGNYNYIAIKLESDWTATPVDNRNYDGTSTDTDPNKDSHYGSAHLGRVSNGGNTNDPNGYSYIPIGASFDVKTKDGGGYIGKTSFNCKYNNNVKTQQFTFCPAGEGFSFGRLAIPDNTYVVLDLNGHTIDRNLTKTTQT